jgi:hypothetical protein
LKLTKTATETWDLLRFIGTSCIHHQGALKIEATSSSKVCLHLQDYKMDLLHFTGTSCVHHQGALKMEATSSSKLCLHLQDYKVSKARGQQGICLKNAFRYLPGRPRDRITATWRIQVLETSTLEDEGTAIRSFETSGTTNPTTQLHNPEELNAVES